MLKSQLLYFSAFLFSNCRLCLMNTELNKINIRFFSHSYLFDENLHDILKIGKSYVDLSFGL